MTAFATEAFAPENFDAGLPVGWVDLGQQSTINGVSTSDGRIIQTLKEWNGRIYLGYGDYDANQPSEVEVLSWNTGTGAYATSLGQFYSHCNASLREVDGELWMPAIDVPSTTHGYYGVVDASHGYTEVNASTAVTQIHLYDAIAFDGKVFLCGAAPTGTAYTDASDAKVWYSSDGGSTWNVGLTVAATANGVAYRFYGMFVLGSTIYAAGGETATPTLEMRSSATGTSSWSSPGHTMGWAAFRQFINVTGAVLYVLGGSGNAYTTQNNVYRYTGSANASYAGFQAYDLCLGADGLPYVLRDVSSVRKLYVGNAAGTSWSDTGITSIPSNAVSVCVTADAVYVGTTDSHVHRIYT
jgi:hypothetical protein